MDVTKVLFDILVVLVAAKIAAELAERLQFPAVVGEIVAGILIGPSVLGLVHESDVLRVLGELGVILLLLEVGMAMDLRELSAVGRASLSVAVVGVVVPMGVGWAATMAIGESSNTALFLGAALSATSVGITARVFSDLRALASVEARTVLGAAVADDVLGLVILTVVVRIVTEGSVSLVSVLGIVGVALAFLVLTAALGGRIAIPLFNGVSRYSRSAGTMVALALAFTLAFAELADAAKLAPIVGAFVAGLALSRSSQRERITRELAPVGHLFIPVFFLEIGIQADVQSFVKPAVLGVAGLLLVVAIIGKLVAAVGAVGAPGDKPLIGIGMIPRGEVGLIFATIGLREHVLGENLYASLLLVVLITTLITPPLLRWRLLRIRADKRPSVGSGEPMPEGGWLVVDEGVVELAAEPPAHLGLAVGFEGALALAGGGRPGRRLLDWLGSLGDVPLRWDRAATDSLFDVLLHGDERSWRFLETTGLLEAALPELAETVSRRRRDPFVLEASSVLRFELVDRIRSLRDRDPVAAEELGRLEHPEWLLLAALILETTGEDGEGRVEVARRLVKRLDLGAAAEQEIALLIDDAGLLRGAASRVEGLDEESVLQLATHLERTERARALYVLSVGLADLEAVERRRLDDLLALIVAVLEQPSLTGLEARNLVERRRAEAIRLVGEDELVADRIQHAPRAYLLQQEPVDIARQSALLEPLPGRGDARVYVLPVEDAVWQIEVACRDRPALLATVAGVLSDHGLDVLEAMIATWGDGGALESFRVRREPLAPPRLEPDELALVAPPNAPELASAVEAAFGRSLESPPNPDAEITFDDAGSPWYTICEVRSPDRRGLLKMITVGLASAGASVHSARLVTLEGRAVDRFELTDANGRKLDREIKDAVREAILGGVRPRRRRFGRRSRAGALSG